MRHDLPDVIAVEDGLATLERLEGKFLDEEDGARCLERRHRAPGADEHEGIRRAFRHVAGALLESLP